MGAKLFRLVRNTTEVPCKALNLPSPPVDRVANNQEVEEVWEQKAKFTIPWMDSGSLHKSWLSELPECQ